MIEFIEKLPNGFLIDVMKEMSKKELQQVEGGISAFLLIGGILTLWAILNGGLR